ncbi:trypco2 family protein [Microbispora sp. H10836]|uniref:trypco2 family protein n=1 Tax=Microbispora sp. H10836 TaxID=2729106 RepID=UPI001472C984|nr:trypco2 family protein [Microbispora sp. H10836]
MRLSEAINAVRNELLEARRLGEGTEMPFDVGDIEIEFSFTLTREKSAKGGIKVWVLEAEGAGSRGSATVNKVTVNLSPKNLDGSPAEVGY